jgi:SsrA-binding protein
MPTIATNRKIRHDYEILETLEAGIKLTGAEVKSAKLGQMKLQGAYVTVTDRAALLIGARIAPYQKAIGSQKAYDPERTRALLLHKEEIRRLIGKASAEGLTIVPLSVYTTAGLIKVELGLARGKRKHDKRESLKKREADRRMKRRLRQY